jgi:hypothetical protein
LTSTGWTIRPGKHKRNLVARRFERGERLLCEVRRAGKN